MMVRTICYVLSCFLFFSGCATVNVPNYIKDERAYKKRFDVRYDQVLKATMDTLRSLHWDVEGQTDPSVFEALKDIADPDSRQTMIFSSTRQVGFLIGSKQSRVNVFLRGYKDEFTEVEIRYITITKVFFKRFISYQGDPLSRRIFDMIQRKLRSITP